MIQWTHAGTMAFTAFLASLVEAVEALTIVLAVGVSRGWHSSLLGAGSGLIVLSLLVIVFGPLVTHILFPLTWLQLFVGVLLLLFGLGWLRKAVLRAANIIPLHDESYSYNKKIKQMAEIGSAKALFDTVAFTASFKAVLLEGIEVVFIIVTIGTAETSFLPAVLGSVMALLFVILLGIALHQPLTRVPENNLKFCVGAILTAFGLFWIGEGSGLTWPGHDLAIPALIVATLAVALVTTHRLKKT